MKHTISSHNDDGSYTPEILALAEAGRETWQYAKLRKVADDLAMPEHYETDLTVHDAAAIAAFDPQVMLWHVRPSGTHFHTAADFNDDNDLAWRRAEVQAMSDSRFFFVNYEGAQELTAATYASRAPFPTNYFEQE